MTVQLPLKFDDPWTPEQILAGSEQLDMTQVMRLFRQKSHEWDSGLFLQVAERALERLRAAHGVTRQDDALTELWGALYEHEPAVAPAWLQRICPDRSDIDLLTMLAGKIDCRQDARVIEAALLLSEQLLPGDTRLRTWLLSGALRDYLSRNQRGLFETLIQDEWVSKARIEARMMSGNALALWALSLPEARWNKVAISDSLEALLKAGADPMSGGWIGGSSPSNGQNQESHQKIQHGSLLELLCYGIDEEWEAASALECALDCAIDHGIPWGSLDLGARKSARIIRDHPRYVAACRKEALTNLIDKRHLPSVTARSEL